LTTAHNKTRWAGAGRRLTQTGQLTMADVRHLDIGDEIDPVIDERVYCTRSAAARICPALPSS
jgi:hypothetical protein